MGTRVTFTDGRIGRHSGLAVMELETNDITEVQDRIMAFARTKLTSKTIWLDADNFGGDIWAGMRRVAHFTIETGGSDDAAP